MEARLARVPEWRRQPYKLFFPLGLLLTWAGVLHWVLVAVGVLDGYRAVFHSIAQVQGFLMSFAIGFLFTAVPRRTETDPPRAWQMLVCAGALVATVTVAWFDHVALSQALWFVAVVVLAGFVIARLRAGRPAPVSFVWIPAALLMGVAGSTLAGIGGANENELWHLHELGRLLLLQGMFVGIVLGAGGMVLPLLTRGESAPDAGPGTRSGLLAHLATAALLAGTFLVEQYAWPVPGRVLRALLIVLVLIFGCGAHRPPTRPGTHRWLVWVSVWCLPAGYLLAAALPAYHQIGLHVVFIAGFSMLTLSVALHVTLAHGGRKELVFERHWQVAFYGTAILVAVALRTLSHFDGERRLEWLGWAAGAFLLATVAWTALAVRGLGKSP